MGLVYVLNKRGKPLMPTSRCGHVRKLLKAGQAAVVKNRPFTIRLKYETEDICQPLILGIDTGRENIGLAVCKKSGECVYAANVETHNGSIRIKMQKRAAQRRQRRITAEKGSSAAQFEPVWTIKPALQSASKTRPVKHGKPDIQALIKFLEAKSANRRNHALPTVQSQLAGFLLPDGS